MIRDIELINEANQKELEACSDPQSLSEWARFGFFVIFHCLQKMKNKRYSLLEMDSKQKEDGSPATKLENEIEKFTLNVLRHFSKDAGFIGEESGRIGADKDIQVIIDPIDGTRSLLDGFDTYAITLTIISTQKNITLFSAVCNPPTKEIGYRIGDLQSKVFQFQQNDIRPLPLFNPSNDDRPIINVHPSSSAISIQNKLSILWASRKISLVKSISGSPALHILESAKGKVCYINIWSKGGTEPYDLIGPAHLIRGSTGGHILDKNGNEIDASTHSGTFFSGTNLDQTLWIINSISPIL